MDALDKEYQHFDKDALPALCLRVHMNTSEQDGSSFVKRTLRTAMHEMST
jgi:hypothetical protein